MPRKEFWLAPCCSVQARQVATGRDRCRQDTESSVSYFRTKICVGKNVGFAIIPALITCFKSVREGHRIRHYGLLANGGRAENIAKARALLAVPPAAEANSPGAAEKAETDGSRVLPRPCPHCGGRMIVIEVFARGAMPRYAAPATAPVWIDTS